MSWTKVEEQKKGEQVSDSAGVYDLDRAFIVVADADASTFSVLGASHGGLTIPARGEAHPDKATALCHRRKVTKIEERTNAWRVECEYTTDASFGAAATPPLSRPWEFSFRTAKLQKPVFIDRDGDQIVNSAGDPFDPLPELEFSENSVVLVRNEASYNPAQTAEYENTVNDADVDLDGETYAAGMLFMESIQAERIVEDTTTYYRVTYIIRVADNDWQLHLIDVGYRYVVAGDLYKIVDASNSEVTQPQKLDGSGAIADPLDPPVVRNFDVRQETDWSVFSFA